MPDIKPKGTIGKKMGGVQNTIVDNGTRGILSMDINPRTLKGAGSGKVTKDVTSTISQANAKLPKK